MNLSEIKRVLGEEKIQLTKSLGQNFLHDRNQLTRVAAAAELNAGENVLEIGPGLGALTQPLLEKGVRVLAIEKDERLYQWLKGRFSQESRLELLHADALNYLQAQARNWSDWKLVSNLPYSVASPILVELAKAATPPRMMVTTLQLEVAQRLAAAAGDGDYGVLTLLVQLRYEPRGMFNIPAGSFFPAPDVDSACITLIRREKPLLEGRTVRSFEKLVKRGFSQRRKMMMKLLKADWPLPELERAFGVLNISAQARAETVTLHQFVEMAKMLSPHPEEHGRNV